MRIWGGLHALQRTHPSSSEQQETMKPLKLSPLRKHKHPCSTSYLEDYDFALDNMAADATECSNLFNTTDHIFTAEVGAVIGILNDLMGKSHPFFQTLAAPHQSLQDQFDTHKVEVGGSAAKSD